MQTVVRQPGRTALCTIPARPVARTLQSRSQPQGVSWGDAPGGVYFFPAEPGTSQEYGLGYYGGAVAGERYTWVDWCLEKCCCCFLETELPRDGRGSRMPFLKSNAPHDPGGGGPAGLSKEIYAKIREVDAQSSTLTHAGAQGLSARILDKIEYHEYLPDGSPETFVCQTVELVKRPGQSLGLFLREGNSIERSDGVFVSRLARESELHHHPQVVRPLDEILTVNNVDVRHMSIDDVVVIMSIPRRLILRIRYIKARREIGQNSDLSAGTSSQHNSKPVVVVKDGGIQREDSKESAFTDDNGGPGPTPTAQTSLGIKARQQLEEIQRATGFGNLAGQATLPRGRHWPPPSDQEANPKRSNSDRRPQLPGLNPRQQFALHNPRLLDSFSDYPEELIQLGPGGATMTTTSSDGEPMAGDDFGGCFGPLSPGPLRRPIPPPRFGSGVFGELDDYGPPPVPPKPVLRQPSAFPLHSAPSPIPMGYPSPLDGCKSSSLPRGLGRRGGPRVKWKNDVEGGRGTPLSLLPAHFRPFDGHSDSDCGGAYSAPEFSPGAVPFSVAPPMPMPPPAPDWGSGDEGAFSAAEYRAWGRVGAKLRSSSLPPRGVLADMGQPGTRFSMPPAAAMYPYTSAAPCSSAQPLYSQLQYPSQLPAQLPAQGDRQTYARLDVSPLLNRRGAGLRAVGSGWNADDAVTSSSGFPLGPTQHPPPALPNGDVMPYHTGLLTAMTGLLIVHILEGRGLKAASRRDGGRDGGRAAEASAEEIYCVVEVDGEHRARTGVSSWANRYTWNETFEMEVVDARQMDIYVYSWHPQLRHKLCHRGSLKLMEAFVIDKLNGERRFALTLEPRGQLLIRINFLPLPVVFRRSVALRRAAYFGVDLVSIVQREKSGLDVPIVLKRLVEEVERRGLDSPGLYLLCGAAEKKRELRYRLERSPLGCDLSPDTQPDTNVLTSVLRDFLRELPEPPVPPCVFQMLMEGLKVCLPNDKEGNARLMLGIVDCIPKIQKCLMLLVLDHLAAVASQSPHNGMSLAKLGSVFGPLLFSTAQPSLQIPPEIAAAAAAAGIQNRTRRLLDVSLMRAADFLDLRLAESVLCALLQLWPGRTNSSGSENSTLSLTANGSLPLMDVWLQENRLQESDC